MSNIDFINNLLNNSEVEWRNLGDISIVYGGLTGKSKNDFEDGNASYVPYKNIFYNIAIDFDNLESVKVSDTENQRAVKYGDVLFTGSSEKPDEAGMSSAITQELDKAIYLNSFSFGVRFNSNIKINPHFSKHLFRSHFMRKEIIKTASGVTRFNISKARFKKLQIPIPPLNVQAEIVRILDAFTELTSELTSELVARKQQYAYYREQLLTFEEGKVEWKALGEVAEYSKTRISHELLNEKNYVGVNNLLQDKAGKEESSHVPTQGNSTKYQDNDILIGNIRPYLKKIWQADCIGGTNGDVLVIHATDKAVNPRYLYQILADDDFFNYNMQHAKGAKMPRGDKTRIMEYKIPIPSLAEQQRIVTILDKFDTLTTSLTEGLPREIALRQQQYEYYRELLLSFPKLETCTDTNL